MQLPKGIKWEKPKTLVEAPPAARIKAGGQKAIVTYVGDGDTLQADTGAGQINCRIDSIDAPEKRHDKKPGQPYGVEAGKALQAMVLNKEVTVRIVKPSTNGSNYGRDICQIEISGKDVSHEMVKAGAAWIYDHFVTRDGAQFAAEQQAAQRARLGLWGLPNPQRPSDFRREQRAAQ